MPTKSKKLFWEDKLQSKKCEIIKYSTTKNM